jgi:pimeloyl-ACP methyl ester carboxylesterase
MEDGMQTEKTFNTGEVTLNYTESGVGKPLVLLHGLTANKLSWSAMIPTLAAKWHVFALDLRGHGQSGRAPDEQYHNADYARDVIAFLKSFSESAVLIGHSLGAMVSVVTAAQYPAGISAVVLLDPPLYTYTGSVHLQSEAAHWFSLVASTMKDNPSYDTVVAKLRIQMPDAPDEQLRMTANFISHVAPGAPETALRDEIWQGVDLPHALQQITSPTLLIHGDWESGAAIRPEDVAFFSANCPAATIVHLPGADHGLKMQEQPELVLDPIRAFLQ